MNRAGWNPVAMEYLKAEQLLAEGDAEAAIQHLAKVEQLNPNASELHIKKGEAYLKLKQWDQSEKCFKDARRIDPENPGPHVGLCKCFLGCRRNNEAAEEALTAIGLAYFNPTAHFLLGVALHRIGRPLDAVKALKVAVLQNPNHVPALKRISYIIKKRLKDPETAEDYHKKAGEARQRIRALKTSRLKPDDTETPKRTAFTSDQDVLELDSGIQEKLVTPLAETITIVSGLPRSGTSMMMQILAAGGIPPLMDDKRPADTHNEKGYYEDTRAKAVHLDTSWLLDTRGKAVKIVAQLLSKLPIGSKYNYGVIFMVRDLDEVVASQRDMLASQSKSGAGMPDTLLQHTFITQLKQTKKFLAIRRIPTLYVRYKDCIQNPTEEAARINAFLGRSLDKAAMAAVVDAGLYRHKKSNI
jgi:tetratricopeptide (TPR) repeat protein